MLAQHRQCRCPGRRGEGRAGAVGGGRAVCSDRALQPRLPVQLVGAELPASTPGGGRSACASTAAAPPSEPRPARSYAMAPPTAATGATSSAATTAVWRSLRTAVDHLSLEDDATGRPASFGRTGAGLCGRPRRARGTYPPGHGCRRQFGRIRAEPPKRTRPRHTNRGDSSGGAGPRRPARARAAGATVVGDGPERVVRDLPGMAVGVDGHPRVATPERLRARPANDGAGLPGLFEDAVDLVGRAHVESEGDPAPATRVLHGAVLGEGLRSQRPTMRPPVWKKTTSSLSSPRCQPSRS